MYDELWNLNTISKYLTFVIRKIGHEWNDDTLNGRFNHKKRLPALDLSMMVAISLTIAQTYR
ncbi:hypothetical protein HNQ35_002312 [Cerasibacillus quisquiliarum]|uniref:Uncharacterized protein n=1 Tax=Cerasibacillus quisquiliarum TaxID=227865 RepID=A0A511UZP2_9BACI|nr:hypothetical protein [Cerasibacillus quisquiliarum]MBB5147095.1 hypothetical protein [Cerasibacillus quisquiliarum]GEN32059.1 hypothetical protein CQU01_22970 [Cerasibacillus quisquiliarum]